MPVAAVTLDPEQAGLRQKFNFLLGSIGLNKAYKVGTNYTIVTKDTMK